MIDKEIIKVAVPCTGEEEIGAIREVLISGNFVSGKKVAAFEDKFSSYIGVSHAAAVNSGTAALHIALAVLGIGPTDEVIVPSLTFMSTVTAVLHQNAIPVFADIDIESFCISPEDIRRCITKRTKAIIPVHLYGNAADMDEIMKIADEFGISVIEDCAQAHGTEYREQRVGSIGHVGAFSFFATKHMTTGEGGIVTSNSNRIVVNAKRIRSHGMVNRDKHELLGYNYRMNEIAAAMGLVQLEKLDDFNEKRIKNSLLILDSLAQHQNSWYKIPKLADHIKHTFFWCPIIIPPTKQICAKDVVKKLKTRGVEARHRYYMPLYKQKVILDYSPYPNGCPFMCHTDKNRQRYDQLNLPNVESIAGNIIGLPNHPLLREKDIEYIIKTINELY